MTDWRSLPWDEQWHWLRIQGTDPIQIIPIFRKSMAYPCMRSGALFDASGDLVSMNSQGERMYNRLAGSIEMDGDCIIPGSIVGD